jgi:hypothetical protein
MQSTLIAIIFFGISNTSRAQQVNWRNLQDSNAHIINVNMGWDYATVAGIGYGQKLKTHLPIVLNMEYSFPFGNDIFDDFKTKIGAQAELLHLNNFSVSLKAYGLFRRYANEYVRLINFGSEFSTNFGYYKTHWYIAGEFGFDKAIATNIKNSDAMKNLYPDVQDGWYVPTGGNFFYGIVSGYSFKYNDLYAKIGMTTTQDFKTEPGVPYYLQIGYNRRF